MTYRTDILHLENDDNWKDLLCDSCRYRLAEVALEGKPLCIDCADNGIEWEIVHLLNPELARTLLYPYQH